MQLSPYDSTLAAIACVVWTTACTKDECLRPLDKWCEQCPTFDDALVVARAHGTTSEGVDYQGDVHVWQCEDGGAHVIQVLIAGDLAGREEHYEAESGRLVGVTTWSDTPSSCGLLQSWGDLYGEVLDCENRCLSEQSCLPADDQGCVDFAARVDPC